MASKYVEDRIEANYNNSAKKKPQSFSSGDFPKMKGVPIQPLKELKVPKGDDKSNKVNGLKWGKGQKSTWLAFARQDHFMGIMDAEKNIGICCAKAPWTQCIEMHPSNNIVLTGGMDNATTIWKYKEGSTKLVESQKIIEHDGYISSIQFMGNSSTYISSAGDADSRLIDLEKKQTITRFCGHDKDAQSLCFARDDAGQKTFATCSSDKTVKLWEVNSGKCVGTFETDSELNTCAMFPRENTAIACGGEKDKTYLFDIRAMMMVSKYARNNQKTASCEFSSSGRHLYVGHDDGAIIMWDIFDSGENKMYANKVDKAHTTFETDNPNNINVSKSRVQALKVGPDGLLASGGFDGKVKIWGANRGA